MAWDEFLKNIKIDFDKYGFFFWIIVFGVIEVIFSLIYRPDFIAMGIIFSAFGCIGYGLSELLDRISYGCFQKENQEQGGNKVWVVKTPLWFHIVASCVKILIFIGLFLTINIKYKFF